MGDPGTMPILLKAQSFTGAGFAGDAGWELFLTWVAGFAGLFFGFGIFFLVFCLEATVGAAEGAAAFGWFWLLREEV